MLTYSVWAGNYALIIPKQLRDLLVAAGWHKQDIREYIYRAPGCCGATGRRWAKPTSCNRSGGPDQEFTALQLGR